MKTAFVIILVNLIILLPLPAMGQEDSLAVRPFTEHPLGLLEGRVAGVEVISSAGVPGLKPTIWVNGLRLHESMAPLYVVDGMRVDDLSMLSPDDVASVELRTGIIECLRYGAEAAYGTVIIKTRGAWKEGFHAGYDFQGGMEWMRNPETELSEMSGTSFIGKHHLSLQYDNKWLSANTSFSFLDNDGPFNGRGDAFRRCSGVWTLEARPLKWFFAGTSGIWGVGRADYLKKGMFPTFREGLWSDWEDLSQTSVRVWAEFLPLKGLYFRPYFDYSRRGNVKTNVLWRDGDTKSASGSFCDEGSMWRDGGVEGGYSYVIANAHKLSLDAVFRRAVYSLYLTRFNGHYNDSYNGGFTWRDNDGFAGLGRAAYRELMELPMMELMNYVPEDSDFAVNLRGSSSPRYVWNDASVSLSYQWLGRYELQCGVMTRWGRWGRSVFSSFSPVFLAGWSLTGEPWLRRLLPDWVEKIAVNASWGQACGLPILLSSDSFIVSTYYGYPRYIYSASSVFDPHFVMSDRKNLHAELFFRGAGNWRLTSDWFISDDSLNNNYASVRNSGVALTGDWDLSIGDWRLEVGGTVSFYENIVTALPWASQTYTQYTYAEEGSPLGLLESLSMMDLEGEILKRSTFPSFTYAPRLGLSWRGLTMVASGAGAKGNYLGKYISSSDMELHDAAFFRVRQLALSYDLPDRWLHPIHLNGVRMSVSLEDAFLFTEYKGQSDPLFSLLEGNGFGMEMKTYPSAARLVFGVSILF